MVVGCRGGSCGGGKWTCGVVVGHTVVVGGGEWSWGVVVGRAVVISGRGVLWGVMRWW